MCIGALRNGCKDADDYFNLTKTIDTSNHHTYQMRCHLAAIEWLANLKPEIRQLFSEITARRQYARIGYIPIIKRDYWNHETRNFANDIDFYVMSGMKREGGPRVKVLETRSLYKYPAKSDVPIGAPDDVLPSFLQEEGTHINYWGYNCILNDITPHILNYWAHCLRG